jgi:cytochrome b6-f complex iron-sulfur subunit
MSEMDRRSFLSKAWKAGFGVLSLASLVTVWGFIKPPVVAGLAALVRTVAPDAVPAVGVLEVPEARGYLVNVDGDITALSEVCPHLGCRVPFVDANNRFECPCHGSKFTREGVYIEGPAPRGMDILATEVVEGVIEIDTTQITEGAPA